VTNNTITHRTDFGGLSTESINISKVDKSDLIRHATGNNPIFGGLSTKSADITKRSCFRLPVSNLGYKWIIVLLFTYKERVLL
jgi:hypothetical protein